MERASIACLCLSALLCSCVGLKTIPEDTSVAAAPLAGRASAAGTDIERPTKITAAESKLIGAGKATESMRILTTSNVDEAAILRSRCIPAGPGDPDVKLLVARLILTTNKARGNGIAAPQVGILRRIVIVKRHDKRAQLEVFINPRLLEVSLTHTTYEDGCLSIPGKTLKVTRPSSVVVVYENAAGVTERESIKGRTALNLLHEIDHLDGILYFARAAQ